MLNPREIKFSLPIYWTYKTKKGIVTDLVGANKFRNYHFQRKDKLKKEYHKLVAVELFGIDVRYENIKVKYELFYKNSGCDMNNVVMMIDKFVLDQLQIMGIIKNDNVKYYKDCHVGIGGHDKENPRIEITLSGGRR